MLTAYSVIALRSPSEPTFGSEAWAFLTGIPLGQAYLQIAIAAVLASIVVGLIRTPTHAAWSLVLIAWAFVAQAITGHAAGADDHHLATAAMFLHLVGAAVWLGVIALLVAVRGKLGTLTADVVARTSRVAGWAAILIAVSGVVNGVVRLETAGNLIQTEYGRLLTFKIALFAGVVALAAWYRRSVLPRFSAAEVQARFWRFVLVDIGALVAIVAVAVVLSDTAPPVELVPVSDPSPAWMLTGYQLPPSPTFATWFSHWRIEIVTALACAVAVVVYIRWVRRLRARGDEWPWIRTASWLGGIVVLAWVTQGGPAIYGVVSFSSHMIQHMILVAVVPIPLVFGAPVTLALRALPGREDASSGSREWLRAFLESRLLRTLANPVVAAVNFAGSMFVFYYTPVFEWVLQNHIGHIAMAVHFVAVGYFFVNALIGVDPGPRRPAYPMRLVLLFATMAFHAFFGIALMSSTALLVPRWFGLMGRDWGSDALTDQQFGGQIAWGLGEIPVFLVAIAVVAAWRRDDVKVAMRSDRKADRDDDAELRSYNAMLGQLEDRDGR